MRIQEHALLRRAGGFVVAARSRFSSMSRFSAGLDVAAVTVVVRHCWPCIWMERASVGIYVVTEVTVDRM